MTQIDDDREKFLQPLKIAGKIYTYVDELPDVLTFPLRTPLKEGDGEIDTLSLREPNGDEVSKFLQDMEQSNPTKALCNMVATVAGLHPRVAGKIGTRDLKEIGDYLGGFMNAGPETGASTSQT